jgi:hypothetical protein
MHPSLTNDVAHEHRRDLLRAAETWRQLHPQGESATRWLRPTRRPGPSFFAGLERRLTATQRLASDGGC